jgi:hypothetical protein
MTGHKRRCQVAADIGRPHRVGHRVVAQEPRGESVAVSGGSRLDQRLSGSFAAPVASIDVTELLTWSAALKHCDSTQLLLLLHHRCRLLLLLVLLSLLLRSLLLQPCVLFLSGWHQVSRIHGSLCI